MSSLEELDLDFKNACKPIIDGHSLETNIIINMITLKEFTFNIRSFIPRDDIVNVPSVQNLHHTFQNLQNNNIISSIDYFPTKRLHYFHIYSCPYRWTFYDNINLNFPGGLFTHIREISLYDVRPFEHDFFLRIVQSFPLIKKINLKNDEPQQNVNQSNSINKYTRLMELDLVEAHEYYFEEFLNETKTCLSNDIHLHVHRKKRYHTEPFLQRIRNPQKGFVKTHDTFKMFVTV